MDVKVDMDKIFVPSQDIVAREVQGEFIIIPITSGVMDANTEDALFSLNETGKAIWDKLDGKKSLRDVAKSLSLEFESLGTEMEEDVLGITRELLKRKMLVEAAG